MQFSISNDNKRGRFYQSATFSSNTPDGKRVVEGVAIVYGPLSDDRGGFLCRVGQGSIVFADHVLALINHNDDLLIGNTQNQTLSFNNQPDGLHVAITLPDNVDGDKAWSWVKGGYAQGMSFGCYIIDFDESTEDVEYNGELLIGQPIRTITKMLVDEVTITHSPAFKETSIGVAQQPSEQSDNADANEYNTKLMRMKIESLKICA